MTANPADRKYAPSHEWIKTEGNTGTCGITDHAQHQLTDIVFVELPAVGRQVKAGERTALVESVKSVSDIYAPVSGEIVAVNARLTDAPELVNKDAFGEGWMFKIAISDPDELERLMDNAAYTAQAEGETR
jgi:glycine cleavage system H protein